MREGPLLRSCVTYREGPVSAGWLGPPSRIQSEICNERFTGRPRPIPGDGSTRSTTRSTAEMSWSTRGSWCAPRTGAAGIDRQTIADVEAYGITKLLDGLAADLKDGSYRTLPARRVFIPKPGRPDEQRPLSIPAVRDRVVQAAMKIVIEPIFEADFLPCSFGFRPKRAQHDALQVLVDQSWRGRRWVVESDVANCFEAIPHSGLMSAIEERISDRHLLKLCGAMLRSGVMQDEAVMHSDAGTPQGGVVSPLLCNVYLHRLDRCWAERGAGMLVRFADDLVVMCHSRGGSRARPRGVAGDPRRARPHAQGCQDADRGAARRRGGPGLSGLSSPLGAREHARLAASVLPGPLAPTREDAARPWQDA